MRTSFRLFGFAGSVVAALTSLPAFGQVSGGQPASPNPQQPVVVTGQKPPKPKLVCESFVPTGSIRRQKVCMTEEEAGYVRGRSIAELERLKDAQFRLQQLRMARQMMDSGPPN